MRTIIYVCFLSVFLSLSGCGNGISVESVEYDSVTFAGLAPGIPDSILTDEQRAVRNNVVDFIFDGVYIENNQFKLRLTKEDFRKNGIPDSYRKEVMKSFKSSNKWLKTSGITNLQEVWDESRKSYAENKENYYKPFS